MWVPQSSPQWQALLSRADELFYGGAAGGGKSALVVGSAVECHEHGVIFRRVYPNLKELMRYAREVIEEAARENKTEKIFTFPDGRTIEFGAVQYEDNKKDWQGRPHDLKAFDEITEFTESQYVFICGWNRSTNPGQRVRVLVTGNPPTDESGSWVIKRWGAWLDKKHPHPAKPGELRWYATIDGEEKECADGESFEHTNKDGSVETIYPRSRTFIPARVGDNPYYAHDTHYLSVLQSLPEPLRSQLLNGDFEASQGDDVWQVIPTAWVKLAQRRWLEREKPNVSLGGVGIDPARGGQDHAALAKRYDNWFDLVKKWPGKVARDGPTLAGLAQMEIEEEPEFLNVDVVGVGSSPYDSLKDMYKKVLPVNGAEGSTYRDKSKKLKMRNLRAEMYWRMRDALDPKDGDDLALPPDPELLADLCSARYKVTTAGVLIEAKDEIKKRIGRSPDVGEAVIMALCPFGKRQKKSGAW